MVLMELDETWIKLIYWINIQTDLSQSILTDFIAFELGIKPALIKTFKGFVGIG